MDLIVGSDILGPMLIPMALNKYTYDISCSFVEKKEKRQ